MSWLSYSLFIHPTHPDHVNILPFLPPQLSDDPALPHYSNSCLQFMSQLLQSVISSMVIIDMGWAIICVAGPLKEYCWTVVGRGPKTLHGLCACGGRIDPIWLWLAAPTPTARGLDRVGRVSTETRQDPHGQFMFGWADRLKPWAGGE